MTGDRPPHWTARTRLLFTAYVALAGLLWLAFILGASWLWEATR